MIYESLKKSILYNLVLGNSKKLNDENEINSLQEIIKFKEDNSIKIKQKSVANEYVKPNIPKNWDWVKLEKIATLITDGEHSTPKRIKEYDGYYLLSARNILNGKMQLDDVDYVPEDEYNRISKRCNPQKGDLLISCSGSLGRCCVVEDENNYTMVRSAAMIRVHMTNPKYLMYVIQSAVGQNQIDLLKKQTAQANLFLGAIASLYIPLPPLNEQDRIVKALDELILKLDEIEPLENELHNLKVNFPEKMRKSFLQDIMCINKEDNKFKKIKLKDLVSINTGKKDANYGKNGGDYYFFTCSKNPIKCPDYSFDGEAILLAGNGDIGNINYYVGKFEAYQRTYVLMKINEEIDMKFLYYHLLANWKEYNTYQIFGTAIPYIKLGNVQNYIVNVPTIEEQHRIVEKIEELLPLFDDIDNLI